MARRDGGEARRRFWREVVRRQGRSNLSIREFCRREAVSESGFHWWRRELERRRTKRTTRATTRRQPSAPRFIPLTVTPTTSAAAYELFLPGGVRVLVHASAGERLVDVLSALERPAC
jgi:transposase-like protein